jgi:hypothetical protein
VGTFTGLAFGGALGMDRGMHKLRESLPKDSQLLAIIHENDELKQRQLQETLFSGPITEGDSSSPEDLFESSSEEPQEKLDIIETQLLLDDGQHTE